MTRSHDNERPKKRVGEPAQAYLTEAEMERWKLNEELFTYVLRQVHASTPVVDVCRQVGAS